MHVGGARSGSAQVQVVRLGTVGPMSDSPRLPTRPEELTGFAADLTGFTVAAVADRLGPRAVAALEREDPLPADLALSGATDRLALLIRLFLLGGELTGEQIEAALPHSAERASAWGLITRGRAAIDLRPTTIGERDAWLAADPGEIMTGAALPTNHVLGLGGASATLVDLTVRRPVARALDLGTGSGIQTLGLTTHAEEIVATDVSERALAFAGFNLALNAAMSAAAGQQQPAPRVDLRAGSLFEPVAGTFDLIVSNPPFVISPRDPALGTYTYRDAGYTGDELIQHLIEQIPSRLRPGGIAQLLANWEIHGEQSWDERVRTWAAGTGLDAWVIARERLEPAHYVHTWLRDGGLLPERDPVRYRRAYARWLADLDSRGVREVGFGYVILRKPDTARAPWIRVEELTATLGGGLGQSIAATLAVVDDLARTGDEDLRHWHLTVPGDVTEERYYRPGASDPSLILLRQGGGFARAVHVDTLTAAVMGACDGELSLGQIIAAVATLVDMSEDAVAAATLPTIRGLLTDGLAVRMESSRATLSS